MRDFSKIHGHENLIRDMRTGAVLNTDKNVLLKEQAKQRAAAKEVARDHKINSIEQELAEIKDLLKKLISS